MSIMNKKNTPEVIGAFALSPPIGKPIPPELLDTERFIKFVLPWELINEAPDRYAYFQVWKAGGSMPEKSATTPANFINKIAYQLAQPDTTHVYYSTALSQGYETKPGKNGEPWNKPVRSLAHYVGRTTLVVDLDVKDGAFASTEAAVAKLAEIETKYGLPAHNARVLSGTGGAHGYYVLDHVMTHAEHTTLAHALVALLKAEGVNFDVSCTLDAVRHLRVPGSFNHKPGGPYPVTLDHLDEIKISYDLMRAALAPFTSAVRTHAPRLQPVGFDPGANTKLAEVFKNSTNDNYDEFSAGIERKVHDIDKLASSCGWIKDSLADGGASNDNALRRHAQLIAQQCSDPEGTAWALMSERATLTEDEFAEQFARASRECAEKPQLSFVACATIASCGAAACKSCLHAKAGKSPLTVGFQQEGAPATSTGPSEGEKYRVVKSDHRPINIMSLKQFLGAYKPLEYVVDDIIVRGNLYTLTAATSHAKTTLLASVAGAVVTGRADILGIPTCQGRVAYLTFENPDNFRLQLAAACEGHKLDTQAADDFLDIIDIRANVTRIDNALRATERAYALIVVDTLQAGFDGDDFNNNKQVLDFVSRCRVMTSLPGSPAVVIAAHPIKGAGRDNLVPYGGGAILNEVDGNLTLWRPNLGIITTLHWHGKIRGKVFDEMHFEIKTTPCGYKDAAGVDVKPPYVSRVTSAAVAQATVAAQMSENELLQKELLHLIALNPVWGKDKLSDALKQMGVAKGSSRAQVARKLNYLVTEGMTVTDKSGQRVLTAKGQDWLRDHSKTNFDQPAGPIEIAPDELQAMEDDLSDQLSGLL